VYSKVTFVLAYCEALEETVINISTTKSLECREGMGERLGKNLAKL